MIRYQLLDHIVYVKRLSCCWFLAFGILGIFGISGIWYCFLF